MYIIFLLIFCCERGHIPHARTLYYLSAAVFATLAEFGCDSP